jgi:hypothetical protein
MMAEATSNMLIAITNEDYAGAIPNDLQNCALARACRRGFGSSKVVIFGSLAYVDHEDEDGVMKCFRYLLGEKIKACIAKFDKSKGIEWLPGNYYLLAIPEWRRLDVLRHQSSERRSRPGEKKKISIRNKKGRALIKSKARIVKTMNQAGPIGYVRNGTGLVQTKIQIEVA